MILVSLPTKSTGGNWLCRPVRTLALAIGAGGAVLSGMIIVQHFPGLI